MSEFTPGPWTASGRWIVGGDPREFIAETDAPRFDLDRYDRACADARLIAAAPEMFAALVAIRDANTIEDGEDAIDAMHAAIDKATGEKE